MAKYRFLDATSIKTLLDKGKLLKLLVNYYIDLDFYRLY